MAITEKLRRALLVRSEEGSLRELRCGGGLVDFCSNDYLGLSASRALATAIETEWSRSPWGNGATGSRLLSGNSVLVEGLEQYLAVLFRAEGALVFNSGYSANMALLSSIPQRGDTVLYDHLAHACIKDGARLSLAKRYSFRHNDLEDLEAKLKRAEGNVFIVVESVYSMDGDACPLKGLLSLAHRYGAAVIVDEAHSTGVYGENGAGMCVGQGLEEQVFARVYTFGKAMGGHGACIVGSRVLVDYLVNFARPFIYTTALPPHSVLAIRAAFEHLKEHTGLQVSLHKNIGLFQEAYDELLSDGEYRRIESHSPIQALLLPGNRAVKAAAAQLMARGYDVRPILSPTVKQGEERLRVCLHSYNTEEEIVGLVCCLSSLSI